MNPNFTQKRCLVSGWYVLSFMTIIIFMIFMNFNRDILPPGCELAATEATEAEPQSLGSSGRSEERRGAGPDVIWWCSGAALKTRLAFDRVMPWKTRLADDRVKPWKTRLAVDRVKPWKTRLVVDRVQPWPSDLYNTRIATWLSPCLLLVLTLWLG